jgi:hypothetical protein
MTAIGVFLMTLAPGSRRGGFAPLPDEHSADGEIYRLLPKRADTSYRVELPTLASWLGLAGKGLQAVLLAGFDDRLMRSV